MESKNVRRIFYPQEQSPEEAHKKRVAAYCRVSTMSDNQEGSYEIQRAVYTQKITEEPDWTLAGIYADRGISGTQASRRPQFLKLIEDCEAGKIDIVICKSISRFSRNTLDAVTYIQKLLGLGIRLIFEKEGIDTDSKFSEMLITVLAAFAQEESRSLSENVKWGKRKRRKDGECALYSLYGYRKNAEGDNYEIDPDEAAVVRRIFDQYEHGVSVPQIVDGLLKDGIRPPRYDNFGTEKWDESRLHYMIANERYIGDYLTQKYYKKDFMDSRGYRNEGVLPSVYLEDHHDAIVTREQFERCNIILELKKKSTSSQYPFADYLRCPYCGHVLKHRRLPIQNCDSHFCCEGEGACRDFVIMSVPVRKAILTAYNELDTVEAERLCRTGSGEQAEEAGRLLAVKAEHPVFESIEYWWLDDLVEEIRFGQHSHTASEIAVMTADEAETEDDRTVSVYWKCGMVSTMFSGVERDSQDPYHKAVLWDGYLLRYPDRYPELTEEARKKNPGVG